MTRHLHVVRDADARRANEENADAIRAFLAGVRILRGCSSDNETERGREAILLMAAATDDPRIPMPSAAQCVDAIAFMRSIEPVLNEHCYACSGLDKSKSGHDLVLETIRYTLRSHLDGEGG